MSAPPGVVQERLAGLGRPVLAGWREARALTGLFLQTFAAIFRGRVRGRELLLQCYLIGNKSVPFVAITLAVLGLISVYQVATQIEQIIPDFTMLGAAFLQMMIREFAPTITGLMVATRVGSGIAAEIGSMVVTEQVDALRMCAADPIEYLVVPRFVASVVMTFCLLLFGGTVAFLAGMVTANVVFEVNYATFANFSLVDVGDVSVGIAKCIAYGAAIPIVSARAGLTTFGGSEGVGWATTSAVVNSSLAVIVLNFFISAAGILIFPG